MPNKQVCAEFLEAHWNSAHNFYYNNHPAVQLPTLRALAVVFGLKEGATSGVTALSATTGGSTLPLLSAGNLSGGSLTLVILVVYGFAPHLTATTVALVIGAARWLT